MAILNWVNATEATKPTNPKANAPNYTIKYKAKYRFTKEKGLLDDNYGAFKNLIGVPTLEDPTSLKSFRSTKFVLDMNNPPQLDIQESYDGSVNLLITDSVNPPRLVNSRFSQLANNQYEIVDRIGTNDANIYNPDYLEQQVSLYKTSNTVLNIGFEGLRDGGKLAVGNYTFYFKYQDADGNLTDFVGQTGSIYCHIGKIYDGNDTSTPEGVRGGTNLENSNKQVILKLSNIDQSYDRVKVYYTHVSSEANIDGVMTAWELDTPIYVDNTEAVITISGYEKAVQIPVAELNIEYKIIASSRTVTQIQNRLFQANITVKDFAYDELLAISEDVTTHMNVKEKPLESSLYLSPKNCYEYTGYWNDEIYRFGVVYILKDNTLSSVFPVRGIDRLDENTIYSMSKSNEIGEIEESTQLENTNGVVRFSTKTGQFGDGVYEYKPISVRFEFPEDKLERLKELTNGFFFVRQKRIPTILAQSYALGIAEDEPSSTSEDPKTGIPKKYRFGGYPLLPARVVQLVDTQDSGSYTDFDKTAFYAEASTYSRINGSGFLIEQGAKNAGLISPDVTLASSLYSQLFSGLEYKLIRPNFTVATNKTIEQKIKQYADNERTSFYRIGGVDTIRNNVEQYRTVYTSKLKYINETSNGETIGENVVGKCVVGDFVDLGKSRITKIGSEKFLIRGNFTPFVLSELSGREANQYYNIYISGYSESNMYNYFKLRAEDMSTFFPISDRITWQQFDNKMEFYRGDCIYGIYYTRYNRNFKDPEVPNNNDIITYGKVGDWLGDLNNEEKKQSISRADMNAVRLGEWICVPIMAARNFNFRDTDNALLNEGSVSHHGRLFYPYNASMMYLTAAHNNMHESYQINESILNVSGGKYFNMLGRIPYLKKRFNNRIIYSPPHAISNFQNSFRIYEGLQYKDMPSEYGQITKLINWQANVFIAFEHGLGLLPVNQQTLLGDNPANQILVGSALLLPDRPQMITESFGSKWIDSIIKTQTGIYGIDLDARRIWRYSDSFELISEYKVQRMLKEFIDTNYTRPRESSIVDINITSHYDQGRGDIYFVLHNGENYLTLVYNERLQTWISRVNFKPLISSNINDVYYSASADSKNLWIHGSQYKKTSQLPRCSWFGQNYNFEFEFIVVANPANTKTFENFLLLGNTVKPSKITYKIAGDMYEYDNVEILEGHTASGCVTSFPVDKDYNEFFGLDEHVKNTQTIQSIAEVGRRLGNAYYNQGRWEIVVGPLNFKEFQDIHGNSYMKQGKMTDKYMRVRVIYEPEPGKPLPYIVIRGMQTIIKYTV